MTTKTCRGKTRFAAWGCLVGVLFGVLNLAAAEAEPVRFVPFHDVRMEDTVWRPRIHQLVRDTLPHALRQTEVAQKRLRLCAEWLESGGTTPKPEPHRFNTSDLYKVMEGAALMIRAEPNPAIEAELDLSLIHI